jgi:hypothetical protein
MDFCLEVRPRHVERFSPLVEKKMWFVFGGLLMFKWPKEIEEDYCSLIDWLFQVQVMS